MGFVMLRALLYLLVAVREEYSRVGVFLCVDILFIFVVDSNDL